MRKAAIDVGSNSVLLLVEEKEGEGWRTVYEASDVTSLGAGTKATGLLSEAGMERTLGALATFYRAAHEQGAGEVYCAATMAARIAKNTPDFIDRAQAQKTPVVVLSGENEAALGFLSVAEDPTFQNLARISIVDVGGQSTELVTADRTGSGWDTRFRRSFPIGTLALKGGVLHRECPEPQEILAAAVELDDTIGMCYRKDTCGTPVVLGATGTNLVSIKKKLDRWDPEAVQGEWLTFGEISEAVGSLMRLPERERGQLVGMEPGREATLPAGALILERFLYAIGGTGAYVSTRGWRHALLEHGYPSA